MNHRATSIIVLGIFFVGTSLPVMAMEFPTRDLAGIAMWHERESADRIARAIVPLVKPHLGKDIVFQYKPGAMGAVATQWVYNQPSDGYTLLFGTEHPQLFRVLGISPLDYKDFYAVNLLARDVGVVVCQAEAPWKTLRGLFEDALKHPGKIKMGSTSPGGFPYLAGMIYKTVSGVRVDAVPLRGEEQAITAVEVDHVQFTTAGLTVAREHIRTNRVRALALLSDETGPHLQNIPAITSIYPEYAKYLPWGPFCGVWVKRDVPRVAREKLVDAFQMGFEEPKFQAMLQDMGGVPVGLPGDEAGRFLQRWQSVSCWILQQAGVAKISPEQLNIPGP
jgi:tripartite-type tricarboxylate transporter receptor subunit TctC